VLEELRRYIAGKEDRAELEEIDTLLSIGPGAASDIET